MIKKIVIAALALTAMVSCTKNESSSSESLLAKFSSSISETRATGTEWETGDEVGIIVTYLNDLVSGYHYNNHHAVSFTDPELGLFTPVTELDCIYFSTDENIHLDFYAYYPYVANLVEADGNYPITITDQSIPKAIDFMEASTHDADTYNKNSGTVPLNFTRNMAKITLILKAGTGLELSDITAVRFEGFYTSAIYDFRTLSFTTLSGESTPITPYSEGGNIYSAILIPNNATSHKVYFTTPHGDVPLDLSSYTLAKGEHLSFTVTVSQTSASSSQNTINGWDDTDVNDDTFETE